MTDAFGAGRIQIKPPEKGVFPLDHDGECKIAMKSYLECLQENKQDSFPCRAFSKRYLGCRMDKNLMARENLDNLGLGELASYERVESDQSEKQKKGFTAGLNVRGSRKFSLWD